MTGEGNVDRDSSAHPNHTPHEDHVDNAVLRVDRCSLAVDGVLDRIATIDLCCVALLGVSETMLETRRRFFSVNGSFHTRCSLRLHPFTSFPLSHSSPSLDLFILSFSTRFFLLPPSFILPSPSFPLTPISDSLLCPPAFVQHFSLCSLLPHQNLTWSFPFCPFCFSVIDDGTVLPRSSATPRFIGPFPSVSLSEMSPSRRQMSLFKRTAL